MAKLTSPLKAPVLAAILGAAFLASPAFGQQTFSTPDEAMRSLADAARSNQAQKIVNVLGKGGGEIASSGDPVADKVLREEFVQAYDKKHKIDMSGDNKATAIIGSDDFPFPIPMVRKNGKWQFDTAEGRKEILYRRIGRNELYTIQTCLAYVDAQNEYADKDRTGTGAGIYAQRIRSEPGTKNGLYWPSAPGAEESPLGEFAAEADREGYKLTRHRSPYHGYYYKVLTEQGASAPGGAINYVVKNKMIGGFALVAYPAQYANSGIKTFIVSHRGVVYEKDLGPNTAQIAERMTEFNPDKTWKKAEPAAAR